MIKIKEFKIEARKKDLKALQRDMQDLEKSYLSETTHESTREKKNPAKMRRMRREIAVLKTIIREKVVATIK